MGCNNYMLIVMYKIRKVLKLLTLTPTGYSLSTLLNATECSVPNAKCKNMQWRILLLVNSTVTHITFIHCEAALASHYFISN